MNIYSEIKLYIRQVTAGYLCGKGICDTLREVSMIMPENGRLAGDINTCIRMLTTGEDLPETSPLRSALSVIDEGEPALVILHDMIEHTESVGRMDECLFRTYEEMISYYDEGIIIKNEKVRNTERNKSQQLYERLKKSKRIKSSDRYRSRLIKSMKNDLLLFVSSMVTYTRMMGTSQALKKSCTLMHGFIKTEVKTLRKGYEAGDDICVLCRGFLSELALPELSSCLMSCLKGEVKGYMVPTGGELFTAGGVYEKRRIPGKEICAVVLAVSIGVTGVMGILTKEDKKEGRLRSALSQALLTAVGDMKDEKGTNQIMAGFMQQMLKQVDDDIDLTVRICDLDEHDQTMEVEAVGEYESFLGDRRRISVRRRLSF